MAKKEFTATQVMVLQERLEKKIDAIAERHGSYIVRFDRIEQRLSAIEEQVAINTVNITAIKMDVEKMKIDIASMKMEINSIKEELKQINKKLESKVDISLSEKFDNRISILEQKLKLTSG